MKTNFITGFCVFLGQTINISIFRKYIFWISLSIALLLNLDKIILGPLSLIRVHDTFDSNFPHIFIHVSNILKYGFVTQFPQAICGVSSYSLTPLLCFNILTQLIFSPFVNYLFNSIFVIFIAFLGMFLLLNDEIRLEAEASFIGALFFSSITIWLPGGITVVGVPLLIWALERIFDKNYSPLKKLSAYFYVVIYFFSINSALFGFVLFPFYLSWFLLFSRIARNFKNMVSLVLIGNLSNLINLPAMVEVAINALKSQRNSYYIFDPLSWADAFRYLMMNVFSINMHEVYIAMPTLLGLFIVAYFILCAKKKGRYFYFSIIWVLSIEIFSFFLYKTPVCELIKQQIGFFSGVQFDRFYLLLVILFSILLGIGSDFILKSETAINKRPWFFAGIFVLMYFFISSLISTIDLQYLIQLLMLSLFFVFLALLRRLKNKMFIALVASFLFFGLLNTIHSRSNWGVNTFLSFFSSKQIENLKRFEGENINNFRVARIGGFSPSQLLNNGFKCADGYVVLYSQSYKEFWAKVIKPELTRSGKNRDYFLGWGNRVYLFDSLNEGEVIKELSFNHHLLKLINVKYLFSDKKIREHEKYGLVQIAQPSPEYISLPKWRKKIFEEREFYIYQNKDFSSQVFLTDAVKIFENKEDLLKELGENDYKYLKRHTFLTKDEIQQKETIAGLNKAKAAIMDYELTPDRIKVKLENKSSVMLNLTLNYHPNWICKIDGKEARTFRIYNTFMGVIVPANSHEIKITYVNPYLGPAYLIFALGFLAANIFIIKSIL